MPREIDPAQQHAKRKALSGEVITEKEARAMDPIKETADDIKAAEERKVQREHRRKVARHLDTATEESLLFLTKAFRGAVRLDEPENRILLGAASSTVGAWSRLRATESAQEQTELMRANIYARDIGGKPADYLEDAPKPRLKAVGD